MNEERLNRIEERLAWLERHVTAQDRAMLEQAEEIARLRKDLKLLQSRVVNHGLLNDSSLPDPAEERPPHY